jgi:DNA-binding protein YbaB
MVEVDISGKMEVIAVRISPEALEDNDVQLLQDLVAAAFTNAMEKIREIISAEMGGLAGGMDLSGIPGFPGQFPGQS